VATVILLRNVDLACERLASALVHVAHQSPVATLVTDTHLHRDEALRLGMRIGGLHVRVLLHLLAFEYLLLLLLTGLDQLIVVMVFVLLQARVSWRLHSRHHLLLISLLYSGLQRE
jgi:hypothetical protein